MAGLRCLVFLSCCLALAHCHSSGAPAQACSTLLPVEHIESYGSSVHRSEQGGYGISVPRAVEAGQTTYFSIKGQKPFKGFIVRVLDSKTGYGAGEFKATSRSNYRAMRCSKYDDSATHSDATDKTSVTLEWQAPTSPGIYLVMGTVVENMEHAYAGLKGAIMVVAPQQRRSRPF